jgi:hypothetical protein
MFVTIFNLKSTMEDSFGSLNCIQLKVELSKRGAKTTGTKAALVERLRAYERNQDFSSNYSAITVPETIPMPVWPDNVVFKTITIEHCDCVPPIQKEHIEQYIIFRQGADQQSVSDVKALIKGKLVAEDSIEALSMFTKDDLTFFSGRVNASMKKKLSYSLKIVLHNSGEVQNSHCECPGKHKKNNYH